MTNHHSDRAIYDEAVFRGALLIIALDMSFVTHSDELCGPRQYPWVM